MENEKIEKMISSFQQLPDEGQSYILGISHALLFAQEHFADSEKAACAIVVQQAVI